MSYRQIDYWIRQGWIDAGDANGSGDRRQFTDVEVEAIMDVVAELAAIEQRMWRVRSGEFFHERVAARLLRVVHAESDPLRGVS